MSLLHLRGVSMAYGGPALLEGVDLRIERGERVCMVGRNGSGKSTLMRIIAGEVQPDEGQVSMPQGTRVARLEQEVPEDARGDAFDVVAAGLGELGALLGQYHHASQALARSPEQSLMDRLAAIQHELEAAGGWELRQRVQSTLSRLGLEPEWDFAELSGGLQRRVLLGRALVREPELLLLDEPTNHLDIEAITWLEELLSQWPGALLFVTHDRRFLQRLATRIVELDRGRLSSWPGDYAAYLQRRQAALEAEAAQQAEQDKKLAREEAWVRQGIKARRTRDEGRVRALQALRAERRARREQAGSAHLLAQQAERSGKLVIEAEHLSYAWGGTPVVRELSTTILRGDKVGLIGPNGCGKTTLLRLLLGELTPDSGHVRMGTRLQTAYFDQHRAQLDPEASVLDNVAQGAERIVVDGQPRHVLSYLQDFLFSPQRARTPVRALSGGERNRLLLARLFTRPSNVLVMDEPTNDLDVETLELLEALLVDYAGTVLLVSHDRAFLDEVLTSTLVFEGEGAVNEYVGGYQDWLRQRPPPPQPQAPARPRAERAGAPPPRARKRSYKEQRELDSLPEHIASLEAEQAQLHRRLADPRLYKEQGEQVAEASARLQALEQALEQAYARWEALEESDA